MYTWNEQNCLQEDMLISTWMNYKTQTKDTFVYIYIYGYIYINTVETDVCCTSDIIYKTIYTKYYEIISIVWKWNKKAPRKDKYTILCRDYIRKYQNSVRMTTHLKHLYHLFDLLLSNETLANRKKFKEKKKKEKKSQQGLWFNQKRSGDPPQHIQSAFHLEVLIESW